MFDRKSIISLGLAFLIAFTAMSSVHSLKQNHSDFSSDKDYVTAIKSYQSNEFTLVKAQDFSQSSYTTFKFDSHTFVIFQPTHFRIVEAIVNSVAIFQTLHYLNTAIFKMLFPFHTFW